MTGVGLAWVRDREAVVKLEKRGLETVMSENILGAGEYVRRHVSQPLAHKGRASAMCGWFKLGRTKERDATVRNRTKRSTVIFFIFYFFYFFIHLPIIK